MAKICVVRCKWEPIGNFWEDFVILINLPCCFPVSNPAAMARHAEAILRQHTKNGQVGRLKDTFASTPVSVLNFQSQASC